MTVYPNFAESFSENRKTIYPMPCKFSFGSRSHEEDLLFCVLIGPSGNWGGGLGKGIRRLRFLACGPCDRFGSLGP